MGFMAAVLVRCAQNISDVGHRSTVFPVYEPFCSRIAKAPVVHSTAFGWNVLSCGVNNDPIQRVTNLQKPIPDDLKIALHFACTECCYHVVNVLTKYQSRKVNLTIGEKT